jgi:glycosyltransferase involved in cell wall biosynthesis
LTSAVYVMAPSHYLREALLPLYPTIRLLPNPIDIIHYPYRWRSDFQPRFIWLRAFHSIYNPRLAVEALAQLVGEYPEASLLMIGPDKGDGSLALAQQAAHALAVAPQVKFVGQVAKSAVPGWLSQGDIYLNTTNLDNTPISVMEAMACGLGIVSTNVSGIPYLLTAEQDSLLVPPKDPDALAQAIRRLLTEPGLGARLSANARAKAEQFDWSVILPQWIQILTAAIEGGHP